MKGLIGVLLAVGLWPAPVTGGTVLHCGKVVDVRGGRMLTNMTIVVDGATIRRIDSGFQPPGAGDRVVNLRTQTCMPGLMDMHVHLTGEQNPQSDIEGFRLNPADHAFRSVGYAEKTLAAGFTTVRDLGRSSNVNLALRNAIARGLIKGPRVFAAGRAIATTGGHADPTNGLSAELARIPTPEDGVINSVDDARRAVRQRYKDGVDVIKITATGGVLSVAASGQNPQFTDEEIRAIVETARDYGFVVAAHAHGAEGIKRAVRAGAASIEHGTLLDDEGIALMKKHGTYYVPTMVAGEFVAEKAKIEGYFPPIVRAKAAELGPRIKATFARAHKAGVKIAFGTDSGVSAHGDNGREFALMIGGGMTALEAIRAATLEGATLLGVQDRLGAIEAGKLADVVAVPRDPTEDVRVMEQVSFVMKEGVIYKEPK